MDEADRLAADTVSSATPLLDRAAGILRAAQATGADALAREAARVCRAQPAMAAIWNLAALAIAADAAAFERLAARAARSAAAAARFASSLLRDDARRIITLSRSAAVEACIRALGVPVLCAESRPGLEGRALGADLARDGLTVEVAADAAIATEFQPGDVVLVGADAVSAAWFINKAGTGQLCAAALLGGVPAYVVAGREKFTPDLIAAALTLRDDEPSTLWIDPPQRVRVRNPLFERVPVDRVAGVITDAGLLAGDMIGEACERAIPRAAARELLDRMKQVVI
ncbi:MAG TPA: hypothetical protein VK886_06720 [Vicinamibacterales bacterium]|nr:hypothetical protein [Vicinamibacterales bacterium]